MSDLYILELFHHLKVNDALDLFLFERLAAVQVDHPNPIERLQSHRAPVLDQEVGRFLDVTGQHYQLRQGWSHHYQTPNDPPVIYPIKQRSGYQSSNRKEYLH